MGMFQEQLVGNGFPPEEGQEFQADLQGAGPEPFRLRVAVHEAKTDDTDGGCREDSETDFPDYRLHMEFLLEISRDPVRYGFFGQDELKDPLQFEKKQEEGRCGQDEKKEFFPGDLQVHG